MITVIRRTKFWLLEDPKWAYPFRFGLEDGSSLSNGNWVYVCSNTKQTFKRDMVFKFVECITWNNPLKTWEIV